jgi:hypothetical protein
MSYHILHQFDEQWFGDSEQNEKNGTRGFFGSKSDDQRDVSSSHAKSSGRPWTITILSLVIAACALYFAMDARQQAERLQQRISEMETRLKK